MRKINYLVILIISLPALVISQPGTTALPFLQIGPSPGLGAYMGANTVLPTEDTYGFYYNPAQLGVFSRDNNFSVQFYPNKMDWLPEFNFSDLYFRSTAITGGYILKDFFEETDVNIGIGYMHSLINLGKNVITDDAGNNLGTFNAKEYYDAFSIGFGFEYFARFSFGYTFKSIVSKLAPSNLLVGNEKFSGQADATSHDIGLLVEIPILNKYDLGDALHFERSSSLYLNAYVGYAVTNIGDMVTYNDDAQADPLPKRAQLGFGLSFGLMQELDFGNLQLVEFEVASEAQDILVKRKGTKASYQNGFGDIEFFDHIIRGKSDEMVQVNKTLRLNIAESFSIGFNTMKGPGFSNDIRNRSVMFSTRGIFKFLANAKNDDGFLNDFFSHVDLRYSQSSLNDTRKDSVLDRTKYRAISITLHGLFE